MHLKLQEALYELPEGRPHISEELSFSSLYLSLSLFLCSLSLSKFYI